MFDKKIKIFALEANQDEPAGDIWATQIDLSIDVDFQIDYTENYTGWLKTDECIVRCKIFNKDSYKALNRHAFYVVASDKVNFVFGKSDLICIGQDGTSLYTTFRMLQPFVCFDTSKNLSKKQENILFKLIKSANF
jgi:hypothetical protein